MENNGFNKIINNINEQRGNFGEPLIEKLGLKIGKEISLVKRSISENSNIGVGQKIQGKLIRDVHVGSPIELENSNTSPIKEIKEEQGKYFVRTLTSVYELFLQAKDEGNLEKISELQETIKNIESNMHLQPQSLRDIWSNVKDKICKKVEIQNQNFLFTNVSIGTRDQVVAFVQDENNKNIWKTRVFRYSGSDHQWKSYPGRRANGGIMKGEENSELHHYVQSAKLHKDIYKTIESLPKTNENVHYSEYIPKQAEESGEGGKYQTEFEFKENYETFKNKEWAQFQKFAITNFQYAYERFIVHAKGFNNFTLEGGLYEWLTALESTPEFKNIKDELEKLNRDFKQKELLEKNNLYRIGGIGHEKPELQNFLNSYRENIGNYIERTFKTELPESMMPDFNHCTDKYEKLDINNHDKNNIHIEEYKVKNSDGDELVFAMAYDDKGRVYIDNIYNPKAKMNSYGTIEPITQMGYLVYKPEDYYNQAVIGIPEKYLNNPSHDSDEYYMDISALWATIPVIKQYKQELTKRGVLK